MNSINYTFVTDFNTPFATDITRIMIQEWGYNYIQGFGYKNVSEYKLWKDDTLFIVASHNNTFIGMIAFERYNIAGNSRFTPCICCLYVEPEWRNSGIGEALLQHMCNTIKQLGVHEIYAWTLTKEMAFWFEVKGWKYVIDYNYLDRLVSILRTEV